MQEKDSKLTEMAKQAIEKIVNSTLTRGLLLLNKDGSYYESNSYVNNSYKSTDKKYKVNSSKA